MPLIPLTTSKNLIKEDKKTKNNKPSNSDYSSDTGSIKSTPCFRTVSIAPIFNISTYFGNHID